MRLLWYSAAPWLHTGYGVQAATFLPRLRALGHDVQAVAVAGGVDTVTLAWAQESSANAIPITFRVLSPERLDSQDVLGNIARSSSAQALVTLIDVWPLSPEKFCGAVPWCPWVPIDSEPVSPLVVQNLRRATHPIAMTRKGQSLLRDAGVTASYVPHAFDGAVFRPRDRRQAREQLGWPTDRWTCGMVCTNDLGLGVPSRKAIFEQLSGFALFRARHRDAHLFMHTSTFDRAPSTDIASVCAYLELGPDAVTLVNTRNALAMDAAALGAAYMANLYSALDVLLAATSGEGFGVPIIEAQACGTPVIVGDWTGMAELCGSGWRVARTDAHRVWTTERACWFLPRPEAIAECLEHAYNSGDGARTRATAHAGAYEAEYVTETHWGPLLEKIERELSGPPLASATR